MSLAVIEASFVEAGADQLLALDVGPWADAPASAVTLTPTPLEKQPSAYVQESWRDKAHGAIASVDVKALYTKDHLAIQLGWGQSEPSRTISDHNAFADACAVLFPDNGKDADIATMGSEALPVAGWYWRAGAAAPYEITAHGLGTVERSKQHDIRSAARWSDDAWRVVMVRGLDAAHPHLRDLSEVPVAFALWCGARAERAGLKAYSPAFCQLRMRGG